MFHTCMCIHSGVEQNEHQIVVYSEVQAHGGFLDSLCLIKYTSNYHSASGPLPVSFSSGTVLPLPSLPPSLRYLYLPLVCAERAWALGMELKQEANTEPRKRFHLLRRLNKAHKHALHLLKLCEECPRCDARTRLEAQVL